MFTLPSSNILGLAQMFFFILISCWHVFSLYGNFWLVSKGPREMARRATSLGPPSVGLPFFFRALVAARLAFLSQMGTPNGKTIKTKGKKHPKRALAALQMEKSARNARFEHFDAKKALETRVSSILMHEKCSKRAFRALRKRKRRFRARGV